MKKKTIYENMRQETGTKNKYSLIELLNKTYNTNSFNTNSMIDLFEHIETLPTNVQECIYGWDDITFNYENIKEFKTELETLGYTFEYGLDAQPYDLRKI